MNLIQCPILSIDGEELWNSPYSISPSNGHNSTESEPCKWQAPNGVTWASLALLSRNSPRRWEQFYKAKRVVANEGLPTLMPEASKKSAIKRSPASEEMSSATILIFFCY